jgi:tellurite resistance protein TerC
MMLPQQGLKFHANLPSFPKGEVRLPEVLLWHWLAFGGLVIALLALDLLVFHRHDRVPSLRESAGFSVFWIALALAFNGFLAWWRGSEAGLQFLAGYLVEKSLSVDNVFVFAVIFRFFQVPLQYQYRVLFWGILVAIFTRLAFILAGVALISQFNWILPLFGALLVYTAYKLARHSAAEIHPEKNIVRRYAQRLLPIATEGDEQYGHHFIIRRGGKWFFTPLFLVLLVIESTDVLFAVDSVPAIFGITLDPFIVFTSNVFAILGLRALYFLLAGAIEMFRYLNYGLAAVLGFVGLKMIGEWWMPHEEGHGIIPVWLSLAVIAVLLGISIAASLVIRPKAEDSP